MNDILASEAPSVDRLTETKLRVLPLGAVVEGSGEEMKPRRYRRTGPDAWTSMDGVVHTDSQGLTIDYPSLTVVEGGLDGWGTGAGNVMGAAGVRPWWATHSAVHAGFDDSEPVWLVEHSTETAVGLDHAVFEEEAARSPRVRLAVTDALAVASASDGRIELRHDAAARASAAFVLHLTDVDGPWYVEDARALRDTLDRFLAIAERRDMTPALSGPAEVLRGTACGDESANGRTGGAR